MGKFIEFLKENTLPKFPTEPNAAKFRNALKKAFPTTFEVRKSLIPSNPYDSVQELLCTVGLEGSEILKDSLLSQGWKISDHWNVRNTKKVTTLVSPANLQVRIDLENWRNGLISIFGKKEAKRSNLPYYD